MYESHYLNTVELLNSVGAHVRGWLIFYIFLGTYIRVLSYIHKRKYYFITLIFQFVEELFRSWKVSTNSTKIEASRNKKIPQYKDFCHSLFYIKLKHLSTKFGSHNLLITSTDLQSKNSKKYILYYSGCLKKVNKNKVMQNYKI